MCRHALAAIAIGLTVACTDLPSNLPTAPSRLVEPVATTPPPGPGRVVRTEQWLLELDVVDLTGAECPDDSLRVHRSVWLTVEVRDTGEVALSYRPDVSAAPTAEWQGWLRDSGVEASGTVFDDLPCSGYASSADGAPSTLTGYFSPDARTFSAMEIRRYIGGEDGDIVYYVSWNAHAP